MAMMLGACTYGTGNHTGYVTAVDLTGYIWPTYKVYFKTELESSQENVYCLTRHEEQLAGEMEQAAKQRLRITLDYQREGYLLGFGRCNFWGSDGEHIINYEPVGEL